MVEVSEVPPARPVHVTVTKTTRTIRFDASQAFSVGGILKILQIIINLVGFIMIQASGEDARLGRAVYYSFVAGTGFCISSILLLIHFLHIKEATNMIPWFKVELGYCLMWIIFHLIAGFLTIGLINGYFDSAGYAAFAAMITYTLEAFYNVCRTSFIRG